MNEPKPKGVTNNPDIYREFLVNWKPDEVGKCFVCGMVRPCHRIEDRLVCTPCHYNDARCDLCGQKAIPGISGILVCYERSDIRCLCHEHMHMADEEGASGIEPEMQCPTCCGDGWTCALSSMDIEDCPRCYGTGRIPGHAD